MDTGKLNDLNFSFRIQLKILHKCSICKMFINTIIKCFFLPLLLYKQKVFVAANFSG